MTGVLLRKQGHSHGRNKGTPGGLYVATEAGVTCLQTQGLLATLVVAFRITRVNFPLESTQGVVIRYGCPRRPIC